jgi:uncharacterized protein (DUF2062 family)
MGNKSWLADRLRPMLPTREELERSRLLRPVAHLVLRPALWRFTRRSVPRGIAVGLFVGILVLIPGVQPVAAALAAIPFRANVPLTAGTTLLTNPVTTPLILVAALWVGSDLFGCPADLASLTRLAETHASLGDWFDWLLSSAAPALISGLFVIAAVSAVVGYFVAALAWRVWISGKWRRRRLRNERF